MLLCLYILGGVCTCTCRGFESHPRQLIFLWKSDCIGCAVLLCLVVCMTLLASFFLPSASLINMSVYCLYTAQLVPAPPVPTKTPPLHPKPPRTLSLSPQPPLPLSQPPLLTTLLMTVRALRKRGKNSCRIPRETLVKKRHRERRAKETGRREVVAKNPEYRHLTRSGWCSNSQHDCCRGDAFRFCTTFL